MSVYFKYAHPNTKLLVTWRNTAQPKEQNKSPETNPQKIEVYEFNTTTIKMLNKLRKMMHEQNESINKETENFKKSQVKILELKDIIHKLKNSLERFNSRLDQAEKKDRRI